MTLTVTNLPDATTASDLAVLFAPYGRVASATVGLDPATGRGTGDGLVEYLKPRGVASVLAAEVLNGAEYRGRMLGVRVTGPTKPWDGTGPDRG